MGTDQKDTKRKYHDRRVGHRAAPAFRGTDPSFMYAILDALCAMQVRRDERVVRLK